jgi:hypothetical protein
MNKKRRIESNGHSISSMIGNSISSIIDFGNHLCDMEVGQMSTLSFNNKPYIVVRLKEDKEAL